MFNKKLKLNLCLMKKIITLGQSAVMLLRNLSHVGFYFKAFML